MGKIIAGVAVVVLLILGIGLFAGTRNMGTIKSVTLPNVDLAQFENGEYKGACSIGRWAMRVSVTVVDHKITRILSEKGKTSNISGKLKSQMDEKVLQKQSVQVDAVSGATITCKAYLIAIGDALKKP